MAANTTGFMGGAFDVIPFNPARVTQGTSRRYDYDYTFKVTSTVNAISINILVDDIRTEEAALEKIKEMVREGVISSFSTQDPELLVYELKKVEA